jgi:hypothetical protein
MVSFQTIPLLLEMLVRVYECAETRDSLSADDGDVSGAQANGKRFARFIYSLLSLVTVVAHARYL